MDLASKSFYIRMPGRWVSDGIYLFIKMSSMKKNEGNLKFIFQHGHIFRRNRCKIRIRNGLAVYTGTQWPLKNKNKRTGCTVHKIRGRFHRIIAAQGTLQIFFLKQMYLCILLFQAGMQDILQCFRHNRLEKIIRNTEMYCFSGIFEISISGKNHKTGVKMSFLYFLDHIKTIHYRHGNIRKYQFRLQLQDIMKSISAIFADAKNLKVSIIFCDEKRKSSGKCWFIFNNKYAYHKSSFADQQNFTYVLTEAAEQLFGLYQREFRLKDFSGFNGPPIVTVVCSFSFPETWKYSSP